MQYLLSSRRVVSSLLAQGGARSLLLTPATIGVRNYAKPPDKDKKKEVKKTPKQEGTSAKSKFINRSATRAKVTLKPEEKPDVDVDAWIALEKNPFKIAIGGILQRRYYVNPDETAAAKAVRELTLKWDNLLAHGGWEGFPRDQVQNYEDLQEVDKISLDEDAKKITWDLEKDQAAFGITQHDLDLSDEDNNASITAGEDLTNKQDALVAARKVKQDRMLEAKIWRFIQDERESTKPDESDYTDVRRLAKESVYLLVQETEGSGWTFPNVDYPLNALENDGVPFYYHMNNYMDDVMGPEFNCFFYTNIPIACVSTEFKNFKVRALYSLFPPTLSFPLRLQC